ncbi:MAG: alpha-galactosidase [Aerococcus sp.]|nr:alpha-galactosidase [Aerococcus sp.]
MTIKINEEEKIFHLSTNNSSYVIQILKHNLIAHMYYGRKVRNYHSSKALLYTDRGFSPNPTLDDSTFSYDTLPQEYPTNGNGDYRIPAYQTLENNGARVTQFEYIDYEVVDGKPSLEGLPHSFSNNNDVETLIIHARDSHNNLELSLFYSIFEKTDVITRSCLFTNQGSSSIKLLRAMSMNIDFRNPNFNMLTLYGRHSNERNLVWRKVVPGVQSVESTRISSSAHQAPFVALAEKGTTETTGEIYGFNLVYSGNFLAQVQLDSFETTRLSIGINPFDFCWTLAPNDSFQTPEVIMTFSYEGIGKMSRNFHHFYNNNLISTSYSKKERPIVFNSWEAIHFDMSEEKLLKLAKNAKNLGMELFVVDDGWFKNRTALSKGLGDWIPDNTKFPNGLDNFVQKIHNLGLKFGIWFEPEMVSPDSDLYRAHPEWCIGIPGREKSFGRQQYVLDLSRSDVQEYIIQSITNILDHAAIDYVKWDMNRNITEPYSLQLPSAKQMEFGHRYILGLYYILNTITSSYPHILFENCSSGGGRFDPGMLYYMPQSWTSDNTDPICRLEIQHGTSITYPAISMTSHVTESPNQQVGRISPLETRGAVAMGGNLGYELDLNKLKDTELESIKKQITFYKENRKLIQFGDLYRIDTLSQNEKAWLFINSDKTKVLVTYVRTLSIPSAPIRSLRLNGLNPSFTYKDQDTGLLYGGDELMYSGLSISRVKQDFYSKTWSFEVE